MRAEESAPIVRRDYIESCDDVFERIGLQRGFAPGPAVKGAAEIIQGFFVVGQPPDRRVHIEPKQLALFVKIGAPPPIRPIRSGVVEERSTIRRVLQRTPIAP